MKKISLFILVIITSCSIESNYPKADWTLVFYLADDYSTIGLTEDIVELTNKEMITSDIRLIILYDGQTNGDSKIEILDSPFVKNSRIVSLDTTDITLDVNGDIDMADGETLTSYLSYVKEKLPANNYALYFGSHGTGFTSSYLSGLAVENGTTLDESFLTVSEISESIRTVEGINLVVFDACNLGNIETIYELKDASDYVIASPELIPGDGNDYIGFVKAAYNLKSLTAFDLGKATLQAYYDYYSLPVNETNMGSPYNHEAQSLQQLYDVDKIVEFIESTDFQLNLVDFYTDRPGSATKFNSENYTDVFDILTDTSDLSLAITTAENGIYEWLSIYMPTTANYNSEYDKTAFANDFPDWITAINNQ